MGKEIGKPPPKAHAFQVGHCVCLAACMSFVGCATGEHIPPFPHSAKAPPAKKAAPTIQLTSAADAPAALLGTPMAGREDNSGRHRGGPNSASPKDGESEQGLPARGQEPVVVLDFTSVFALAAENNVRAAFAREQISAAYASLGSANVLWLPSLRAGASFSYHDGALQDVVGNVSDISRNAQYAGLGASAVAAGPVAIPGLSAQFHLKDAIFLPRVGRATVTARQAAASVAANEALLNAALAYLDLLQAEQQRAIAVATAGRAKVLADLTAAYARTGQGSQADADRAETELAIRRNLVTQAEERVGVAAARLREVLNMRQSVRLVPAEDTIFALELTPPGLTADDLFTAALGNRPELARSRGLVAAARHRLQRERFAPLVPTVSLGASYGSFGGGRGGSMPVHRDRFDVEAIAYWEVRNLGLGERYVQDNFRSELRQSELQEIEVMNQVEREIAQHYVQIEARRRQIGVAQRAVEKASDSYRRNLERIRQGQGLPLEVLQSIQALDQAQREYLRTIVDFNEAQFRMQYALGWPNGIAMCSPPAGRASH